jgi:hypothetical protein
LLYAAFPPPSANRGIASSPLLTALGSGQGWPSAVSVYFATATEQTVARAELIGTRQAAKSCHSDQFINSSEAGARAPAGRFGHR